MSLKHLPTAANQIRLRAETIAILNQTCKWQLSTFLAVRKDNARARRGDNIEPVQQVGLAGMAAQTAEGMHGSAHRNLLTHDGHDLLAIDEHAAEGAMRLVTANQDRSVGSRQVVAEMVQDAAASAHASAGHD